MFMRFSQGVFFMVLCLFLLLGTSLAYAQTYTLTPSTSGPGTISPNTVQTVNSGSNFTFTATPTNGYAVQYWWLDGSVAQTQGTTFTLTNILANHTVEVQFAQAYTITPNVGQGYGTITPSSSVAVPMGGNFTFTATPINGSGVNKWILDGTTVQTGGTSYTVYNINTNHTLTVYFSLLPGYFYITPSAGANGAISPSTVQADAQGSNMTFTALPNTGYLVNTWLVDGTLAQTDGTTFILQNIQAAHSVEVTFVQGVTVTASAGANGSVSPTSQTVYSGTSATFTATPNTGYQVNTWTLDGATVQTGGTSYTLNNVTTSHTVGVTFNIMTFAITPSTGANGSISPSTVQTVNYGSNLTFTATPNTGYGVNVWTLDGVTMQTGGTSYALNNITAVHTVKVTFSLLTFAITPTAGANGGISPSTVQTANYGSNLTFTATPNTGYLVNVWTLDGTTVQTGGTSYTLNNITAVHTVGVTFSIMTFTITPSAGANGGISPSTAQTANYSSNLTFTATPNAGYGVNVWTLDGATVQTGGTSYTLNNITAVHSVGVTFSLLTFAITPSAGANGGINPSTVQMENYGSNLTFTATPNTGYGVNVWTLDGATVQTGGTSYTLNNITAVHSVGVTFSILTFAITPTAGANGGISPSTVQTANYGSNLTFTATPNTGYGVNVWTLDGDTVQTGGTSYTLNDITGAHSVGVTFSILTFTVTPSTDGNGSIDPNTAQPATYGSDLSFTASPNTGYLVNTWMVNGTVAQTGGTTFTLSNITADTSVEVTFTLMTFTVTPSSDTNGSINPNTAQTATYGSNLTFTATPNTGYTVNTWSVDGTVTQTGGTTFTLTDITADTSVEVTFTLQTFTITPSTDGNGTINPNTAQTATYGSSLSFTAAPNVGYTFNQWLVDGSPVAANADGSVTVNNITANHTVEATFTLLTFTVTPSTDGNGTISPNTVQTVNYGGSATFTAAPNTGYAFNQWLVDGSPVAANADGSVTVSNITANHTVEATFTLQTFTVTPSTDGNGTISPNTVQTVNYGDSATFTAAPYAHYVFNYWLLDGNPVAANADGSVTVSNITANHTMEATFTLQTFTVTPSTDGNGSINPSTAQTPTYGSNLTFAATPNTGYQVNTWLVDGTVAQTGGTTFTLTDITAAASVEVTFMLQSFTVTPSSDTNGSINPNTAQTVTYGSSITFTASTDTGYGVNAWSVDGTQVQLGGTSFTLANITANHTVAVTTSILTFTVTPTSNAYGSINPSTAQTATYGSSLTFTATPNAGSLVNTWSVDGTVVQTGGTTFTLTNIIANHTVQVLFDTFTLTATPASPQLVNTPITLMVATTSTKPEQYEFRAAYLGSTGTTWNYLTGFTSATSCNWTPTTAGNYLLVVYARVVGNTDSFDVYASLNFQVNSAPIPPVTAVTLGANPPSPALVNMPVTLTAVATGGSQPQYQFRAYYTNATGSQITEYLTGYTNSATYTWTPTATGTYELVVYARSGGNTNSFDVYTTLNFQVITPPAPPVTSVTLGATPASPELVNTPITLSAVATGGSQPQYEFRLYYTNAAGLQTVYLTSYTNSATYTWTPSAAGTYTLVVYARSGGNIESFDAYNTLTYTIH